MVTQVQRVYSKHACVMSAHLKSWYVSHISVWDEVMHRVVQLGNADLISGLSTTFCFFHIRFGLRLYTKRGGLLIAITSLWTYRYKQKLPHGSPCWVRVSGWCLDQLHNTIIFSIQLGTWSSYLADFLSLWLVGAVGANINMRQSHSLREGGLPWPEFEPSFSMLRVQRSTTELSRDNIKWFSTCYSARNK